MVTFLWNEMVKIKMVATNKLNASGCTEASTVVNSRIQRRVVMQEMQILLKIQFKKPDYLDLGVLHTKRVLGTVTERLDFRTSIKHIHSAQWSASCVTETWY